MKRSFTSALVGAHWMMSPVKMSNATRSLGKAVTGMAVATALAPLAAVSPKNTRKRKAITAKSSSALGDALGKMRAAKAVLPRGSISGSPTPEIKPRVPAGAQYLARNHRCAAGTRSYRLYVPASHPKRPKGLIVMLHGCKQTPDDFAVGTHMNDLAEIHGLIVAYPAQTRRSNKASCWNWFKPTNQARGIGEPAILASMTRKLMREFGVGRDDVFVAGLSAGGAMAAILADVYPDVFSAAGVYSGLTRGAASSAVTAIWAMRNGSTAENFAPRVLTPSRPVRWIVFQGDSDRTVHPSNAAKIVVAAVGSTTEPTRTHNRSAGGRDYARREYVGSDGKTLVESWMIENAGHAWSGGRARGSYTDTKGPDASAHMIRFFLTKTA